MISWYVIAITFINKVYSVLDKSVSGHKHIEETLVFSATTPDEFKSLASLQNIQIDNNKILLRNQSGKGSIVKLNKENTLQEWSAELKINKIKVGANEKAILSFWYTAESLKNGSFIGADSQYNGFMAGIEFSNKKIELLIHYNVGLKIKDPESAMLRDEINPLSLANVESLVVKVIHTKKNFVVELYDEDKLVFDTLRISGEVFPLEKHGHMHFGITTSYEKVPTTKTLVLEELRINERKEGAKYDPEEHFIEHNKFPKTEEEEEIKHTIANLNHFMAYIHMVLGMGEENYIEDMKERLERLLKKQSEELERTENAFKESEDKNVAGLGEINEKKINSLEKRLDEISNKLLELHEAMYKNKGIESKPMKEIGFMMGIFGIIIGVLLIAKHFTWKYIMFKVARKQE